MQQVMLTSALFTLVSILMVQGAVQSCGTPRVPPNETPKHLRMNRIYNGWEARPYSFPWMVRLYLMMGTGDAICTGFLIESKHINQTDLVMTAGHCVSDGEKAFVPNENVTVMIGVHNWEGTEKIVRKVVDIVAPFYDHKFRYRDIAILKMDHPVEFSFSVSPICLPTLEMLSTRPEICYASGWGKTEEMKRSDVLKMAQLTLDTTMPCVYGERTNETICAEPKLPDHSVWTGDSGGPLMCKLDGTFYTFGLLQSGPDYGANIGASVGYTRLDPYLDWIKSVIAG